jgi:glycine oxidase
MRGADIVVAGAGAIGGAVACVLARAGRRVVVVDPMQANASSIAAGMLAPAFECAFDAVSAGHYGLLREARDLWPELAAAIDLPLARDGALAVGTEAEARAWTDRLTALGAESRLLAAGAARDIVPGLADSAWAAFTPEDWRLDPPAALARLRAAAETHGARFVSGRVTGFAADKVVVDSGEDLSADRLVIATGAGRELAAFAPELASLTPIKGHILRAEGAFRAQPVVRAGGVYLCTAAGEAVLGATMEAGVADAAIDPAVVRRLLETAAPLAGLLAGPVSWRAAAGVRAATPDGLPLVGVGEVADVILAGGARRNGWLLAPLIARAVLDAVEGRALSGAAARFDPRRLAAMGPG